MAFKFNPFSGEFNIKSGGTSLTKATGAEINTGTDDAKYTTPKAIADSNLAFIADIPVKATGAEVDTGTDDAKFVTAKALEDSSYAKEIFDKETSGSVTRLKHSFHNFLANSSFERWSAGVSATPDSWTTYLSPGTERDSTASHGSYSLKLTTNAQDEQIYQSIPTNDGVAYTFSIYYHINSGSGVISLIAQEEGNDYTEYTSVDLSNSGAGFHLATISFTKPADTSTSTRFKIAQHDATGTNTVILIDECMFQEGLNLATAYVPSTFDSATDQGFALTSNIITWSEVTGTSQSAAVNNGYICNNASLVTVTLPDTAAVGKIVRIAGSGAGGWKLQANTGEVINFGDSPSTSGGYLASTNRYDSVEVICITANTTWVVLSSVGNLTVA